MEDNWYVSDGIEVEYDFDRDVIKWNLERGFLDKPFSLEKEMGYLLSETLESLDWNEIKNLLLLSFSMLDDEVMDEAVSDDLVDVETHDDFARWLCKYFQREGFNNIDYCDIATDIGVFSTGGMAKQGLTKKNINEIRKAVMDKNNAKKPGDVDEHGKQRKGADFVPPEEVIERILEDAKL